MAVYRIFPEKDAFISSENVLANTGKDEIVELGGYKDGLGVVRANRILVKYSTQDIKDVITTKIGALAYSASICMYLADAYEVPVDYKVYSYPIYGAWDNGTGKFGDTPTNNTGVSWQYRQGEETGEWLVTSHPAYTTGSYTPPLTGGGNWYTASAGFNMEFTQSHGINSTHDVDINVTKAIELINNDALENEGFILKLSSSLEENTVSSIRLKYFSADTNTIYPPFLELKWDDSTFVTGSLTVLSNNISTVEINNNKGKYTDVGKQRFRIAAKPKYPARTFSTSSAYLRNYALPSASYWGLRDENTEEMIVDFDTDFTKISCDGTSSYFDVYMDGLQPERYYRILVKTVLDGSTTVVDNRNIFKVVRNG